MAYSGVGTPATGVPGSTPKAAESLAKTAARRTNLTRFFCVMLTLLAWSAYYTDAYLTGAIDPDVGAGWLLVVQIVCCLVIFIETALFFVCVFVYNDNDQRIVAGFRGEALMCVVLLVMVHEYPNVEGSKQLATVVFAVAMAYLGFIFLDLMRSSYSICPAGCSRANARVVAGKAASKAAVKARAGVASAKAQYNARRGGAMA